jgi:branched-chain amino acid transport system ATP-binding protein
MLDEPAAGLSPAELAVLDTLLRRFVAEWDITILLVEHVLSLVFEVSDMVTVLDNGRFVTEGPPLAVASDPRVKAVYLGESTHA